VNELYQIIILIGLIGFAWYYHNVYTAKNSHKEKKALEKKFKLPKGIYYMICLNVFLLFIWLYSEVNFTDLIIPEITREPIVCEIDKTGQYLGVAEQRVKDVGCGISGNLFLRDTYYITAVCPELGGRVDFEIIIDDCGEVVSANIN
jgi:hypothetical protein